jgi:hypothetical protein
VANVICHHSEHGILNCIISIVCKWLSTVKLSLFEFLNPLWWRAATVTPDLRCLKPRNQCKAFVCGRVANPVVEAHCIGIVGLAGCAFKMEDNDGRGINCLLLGNNWTISLDRNESSRKSWFAHLTPRLHSRLFAWTHFCHVIAHASLPCLALTLPILLPPLSSLLSPSTVTSSLRRATRQLHV